MTFCALPRSWAMPEYKCYWRALNQDTKVAVAFGPLAARRYGTDVTLWQGLQGRGDLYRTLLREATTALLNSYNSLQFPYNSVSVVTHMNYALMDSPRSALLTAFRFMRANSGSGNVTCKFTPCKWSDPMLAICSTLLIYYSCLHSHIIFMWYLFLMLISYNALYMHVLNIEQFLLSWLMIEIQLYYLVCVHE